MAKYAACIRTYIAEFARIRGVFQWTLGFLTVALAVPMLFGCGGEAEYPKAKWPAFFPDNKRILYTYCLRSGRCHLIVYDIDAKHHTVIPQPKNESRFGGRVSPDGQTIAFSLEHDGSRDVGIAVINVDGTGVRRVTAKGSHDRYEGAPSFSADGSRLIFFRGEYRDKGVNPLTQRDLFAVDLGAGTEKQITDVGFFEISTAYFIDDGKIIFSADDPTGVGRKKPYSGLKERRDYIEKHNYNMIFIVDEDYILSNNDAVLLPAFLNGESSWLESVSDSGAILFVSRTDKMDGVTRGYVYDLFLKVGKDIRRLTDANSPFSEGNRNVGGSRFVHRAEISSDGTLVVFNEFKKHRRRVMWLMNSDGTEMRRIDVPTDLLMTR